MDVQEQDAEIENLRRGREVRLEQAEEQYNKEGEPDISPSHEVWEYADAGCRFTCTKNMTMHSFCGVSQLVVLQWIVRHELIDTDCAVKDCDGTVRVISTIHWSSTGSQQVSLQCKLCHTVEKGGCRSFFSYGKLGLTKMVMLTFGIVVGIPYKMLSHFGLHVNKNTCTRYVKVIALVIGEKLERHAQP